MQPQPSSKLLDRLQARWRTRRIRVLLAAVAILTLFIALGIMLAWYVVRQGWPQTGGKLSLSGLRAPVTVVRDRYGVPHLYAERDADLYFAQGYVHAQDRFWQMELNRRRAQGDLVELLGDSAQTIDQQWAALDLPAIAARELARMDGATRAPLDAYAAGVNAWLDTRHLPFEFTLVQWRGRPVDRPARWTAQDSLSVSLIPTWQMGVSQLDPSLFAAIVDRIGAERGAFLLAGEADNPFPVFDSWFSQPADQLPLELPGRWPLRPQVAWVDAAQTENGRPLVAIDLPTDLTLPAPWYVLAWHLGRDGAASVSLPGVPGGLFGSHDVSVWEGWVRTGRVEFDAATPPWIAWLYSALLTRADIAPINNPPSVATLGDLQTRLLDTFSSRAARLIPLLVEIEPTGWRQERVTGMLRKWDYRIGDNNPESPFFAVYQLEVARAAFADELGAELFAAYVAGSDLYQAALDQILLDPASDWWDDVTTPEREDRDAILRAAYEPALEWIGRNYGDLHVLWEWDVVHGSRLHHPLGDAWPWDQLLDHDVFFDGWADTINASPGGLPCLGGLCQGGDFFRTKAVYGYRHLFDASDPSTLWFALLPGQSGHPFHAHYDDLLDEWLAGAYVPLRLASSPGQVEGATGLLNLVPGE